MKRIAAAVLLLGVFACTASAAGPVRVSVAGKRAAPVVGRAWTVRLAVRPRTYAGAVRGAQSGPAASVPVQPGSAARIARGSSSPVRGCGGSPRGREARRRASDRFAYAAHRPGRLPLPKQPRSTCTRRDVAAGREQPWSCAPRKSRDRAGERPRAGPLQAVRDRASSVGDRLSLGRRPAAAIERRRAADNRRGDACGCGDRTDRGRPERRHLLLDRDADLPAPRRFRANHSHRRYRRGRRRG